MIRYYVLLICILGCSTMQEYDSATGTYTSETENVPFWRQATREQNIIKSLEANGRIKFIMVKEENKWADWILGAVMVLGGLGMAGGVIWLVYNLIYMAGKYVKSGIASIASGVCLFGGGYVMMEYLWALTILVVLAFIGGLVWLMWYLKENRGMFEVAVKTVEAAKHGAANEETHIKMRKIQGKHQPFFKKLKNEGKK